MERSLWRLLTGPHLKSLGLHILVSQDRSKGGVFDIFKKCVQKSSKIRQKAENANTATVLRFLSKPRAYTTRAALSKWNLCFH